MSLLDISSCGHLANMDSVLQPDVHSMWHQYIGVINLDAWIDEQLLLDNNYWPHTVLVRLVKTNFNCWQCCCGSAE